jgi:hypothetical protein
VFYIECVLQRFTVGKDHFLPKRKTSGEVRRGGKWKDLVASSFQQISFRV